MVQEFLAHVLWPFVCTRAALVAVGFLSSFVLPPQGIAFATWRDRVLGIWCRWDCGWYIMTARDGYMAHPLPAPPHQANWAFFPLYPILLRAVEWFVGDYIIAAVFISNISLLVALWQLYRLCMLEMDAGAARRCVLYLLLFPTSLFLSSGHNESLFLALTTTAFLFARRGRWGPVGVAGFLGSLARVSGAATSLPLFYEYLRQQGFQWRRCIRPAALTFALFPLGLVVFSAYLYRLTGDPLAWQHIQTTWGRTTVPPWEPLVAYIRAPYGLGYYGNDLGPLSFSLAILGLAGVPLAWRRLGPAYGSYTALAILIPLSSNSLLAIGRYLLEAFPLFMLLGFYGKDDRVNTAVAGIFAPLLGLAMALVSSGYPGIE